MIRSNDGKILAISSRDGYCSLVTFDDNELGIPYSQTAQEVIQNATVYKEISPGKRNVVTPKSKTSGENILGKVLVSLLLPAVAIMWGTNGSGNMSIWGW